MHLSRRGLLLSLGATAGISGITPSAWARGVSSSVGRTLRSKIDDYLTRLSGFGYSGATLLAKNGRPVLRKGYGIANEADRLPVAVDTIFDIGSLAKTFTAAAMMLLVERGQVRLGDPISTYLSGVPADKQAITIEQLLSHTAGLDSDFPIENPISNEYEEVSRDEALKRIYATKLIAEPGSRFAYSNMGYMLAAAVVERAGERPFRDFIRSEIFSPLGLRNTAFWGTLPSVPDRRLARSYDETGETVNLRQRSGTTWVDLGGGEVVSTVDDLYEWMQAMRHDKLLSGATRKRMWTPVKGDYGLGWVNEEHGPGGKRIHHGGDAAGGFCAELAYYPDEDMVLANLANRAHQILSTRYAADRVVPQLVVGETPHMWPGEAFDIPPRWSTNVIPLERAIGTYGLSPGAEFVIAKNANGGFTIAGRGQDAIDVLLPTSPEDRALRLRSSERAVAFMKAALGGDTTLMTATLHAGAPAEGYRHAISSDVASSVKAKGRLKTIEPIGTEPYSFPRHSRRTALRLIFENGDDYYGLTWEKADDRIRNMGGAPKLLASIPLRASPDGSIVGWNIVTGRSLLLASTKVAGQAGIEIQTTDGVRTFARRTN